MLDDARKHGGGGDEAGIGDIFEGDRGSTGLEEHCRGLFQPGGNTNRQIWSQHHGRFGGPMTSGSSVTFHSVTRTHRRVLRQLVPGSSCCCFATSTSTRSSQRAHIVIAHDNAPPCDLAPPIRKPCIRPLPLRYLDPATLLSRSRYHRAPVPGATKYSRGTNTSRCIDVTFVRGVARAHPVSWGHWLALGESLTCNRQEQGG